MKNTIFLCFATAMCLLLASCGSEPVGGDLADSYWTLSSAKLDKQALRLPKDLAVSLVFSKGKINGKAPCNSYFADYSTKGSSIKLGEIGATKRACDGLELEKNYFSLLAKANSYSVKGDKLEIFGPSGQLSFKRMKTDEAGKAANSVEVGKLAKLFPDLGTAEQLHLHPIVRVDNPGDYPFQGSLIDTSFYQYFSAEIREIWSGGGGEVMAVGEYGGFYICRVPGRYVSSDIAIFTLKNNEMQHLETIAWAWCDEGWCNQQDAWLTDHDQDGRTDVVQHYTLTDDRGKIKEERMTLLLQNSSGELAPAASPVLDKKLFKMARI
ncbi:MAG: META domain-containing protein [Saprospiraceae bacterium]|nr:META domain-containing protein [Saprospiraceae bacterium]